MKLESITVENYRQFEKAELTFDEGITILAGARNKLYLAVIEMVKQYNPKGFIIENVPGMANMYKGQVKDEVLKRFRKMGYNIDCRILKACDYGVPQMRKRLVFMGVRKDIGNPHFPDPTFGPETKKPYRTCRDAISDLPTRTNNLGKNEDEYVKSAETEYQVLMRDGYFSKCTTIL